MAPAAREEKADMGKQHIFFDLDGTLTDSMPGITRAVQYALRRYGIQVDDLNVLKPFVGPPLPESFKEFYDFPDHDAHEAVFVCLLYTSIPQRQCTFHRVRRKDCLRTEISKRYRFQSFS